MYVLLRGRVWGYRSHVEWLHHFVVLVLDNAAVPDVESRQIESHLHAGDFALIGDDSILEAFEGI